MARNSNTPSDIVDFAEQVLGITNLTEYQKEQLRENQNAPQQVICAARRTSWGKIALILDEFHSR